MTALLDAEHFAATAKPIVREAEPAELPRAGATLKQIAEVKVAAGQPLTDAEEAAIFWGR